MSTIYFPINPVFKQWLGDLFRVFSIETLNSFHSKDFLLLIKFIYHSNFQITIISLNLWYDINIGFAAWNEGSSVNCIISMTRHYRKSTQLFENFFADLSH